MNNIETVLAYLQSIFPKKATNNEIMIATDIHPHQQIFQITNKLKTRGLISSFQIGREWFFQAKSEKPKPGNIEIAKNNYSHSLKSNDFENFAREIMTSHFQKVLNKGRIPGINKEWDLLSEDLSFVGDVKYYSMVNRISDPPAKFSIISEHVWLLEKTDAKTKILVFGNQIEVPQRWLLKYGNLVSDVQFYFLDGDGKLTKLN